jgi:hypothetical protein
LEVFERRPRLGSTASLCKGPASENLHRSIDFAAIEPGPLLGVAQEIIGGRDLFEFLLGLRIAGVEVRMELLGESAIRLLNILG